MDEEIFCPKLKTLIFGTFNDLLHQSADEVHIPCYCFVKGYQTDAFGHKIAVAVQTLPFMLRDLDPTMDILDFDPGCEWVGARPGRFYDRRSSVGVSTLLA
jgi:hypothetical protein